MKSRQITPFFLNRICVKTFALLHMNCQFCAVFDEFTFYLKYIWKETSTDNIESLFLIVAFAPSD